MNRLVAFGCSYTFGMYLDGADKKNRIPSTLAWPSLLAQHLDKDLDNRALPGAGNLEILWEILQYPFNVSDTCFIMWSHFTRGGYFTNRRFRRLRFSSTSRVERDWLTVHPEYDQIVNNWFYIHHADVYLKSTGINVHHLLVPRQGEADPTGMFNIRNIIQLSTTCVDQGSDGSHPGPLTNKLIAAEVINKIYIGNKT